MKKPGIRAQEQMVYQALHIPGYRLHDEHGRSEYRITVPSNPGESDCRYSAASFEVERHAGFTKIRADYGIYLKGIAISGLEPAFTYNTFIQLPFLKTTIATAFGFKPIPAPWIK